LTTTGTPVHDPCMAVKTITIDVEAYEVLSRLKKEGQSFSQVIKENLRARHPPSALLRAIDEHPISEDTLDEIERLVQRRREDPARAPDL
jgi:predicted CopG family antitoxin